MRVSRLMLVTLRSIPADAEIPSHQLLLRAGYIRRVSAGIYAYLPLMWKVLQKITRIVQQELDSTGALQTLLPQLQPSDLWERSGRWQGYTAGEGIMFHLKDRQGRELGLGPTHEEVITSLAGDLICSYRQLPITLYQIQSKFRDEIRPRFGLMRSREFIMKDAYSFHADESSLKSTYTEMDAAYRRIFSRCGLDTVAVDADSGAIGGAASQEYMVKAENGEDLILLSNDGKYAANQEKAISIPPKAIPLLEKKPDSFETEKDGRIETLCSSLSIDSSQIIKVILLIAELEDNQIQPVIVSIRGDQDLNEVKLINNLIIHLGKAVIDLSLITPEKISAQGLQQWPFGAIGPDLNDMCLSGAKKWKEDFFRIADKTATEIKNFVCGANEKNKHRICNWNDLGGIPLSADLRKAQEGDSCVHDQTQKLIECRGIEIGHIFQLGTKYSQSLGASFTSEEGKEQSFFMGCYGIGISRLAQASIEQHHDEAGISWPVSIAPYEVIVVIANMQDQIQNQLGEKLYQELKEAGIDVLIDDRKERAGVKFKDADLIGIPWRVVVGRDAQEGKVELFDRSKRQSKLILIEDLRNELAGEISAS